MKTPINNNWADPVLSKRKEQLSIAYIRAIAAGASCVVDNVENDIESVDVTIKSLIAGTKMRTPKIDVQAKCTSQPKLNGTKFAFAIDKKNFDDLAGPNGIPKILVVVIVPTDELLWIDHSEDRLEMRKCAYWLNLDSASPTSNKSKITVHIPRSQQFTPATLKDFMATIGSTGRL